MKYIVAIISLAFIVFVYMNIIDENPLKYVFPSMDTEQICHTKVWTPDRKLKDLYEYYDKCPQTQVTGDITMKLFIRMKEKQEKAYEPISMVRDPLNADVIIVKYDYAKNQEHRLDNFDPTY